MEVKWLHISIYCAREKWKSVLYQVVAPYVAERMANKKIYNYRLHFNADRGSNLRLTVQVEKSYCTIFLDKITDMLKAYFSQHAPPYRVEECKTIDKFLLDYPENAIFYKLYQLPELPFEPGMANNMHKLLTVFSDAFLDAFENEEFDDDIISTFYTYASFILLLQFESNLKPFLSVVQNVQGSLCKKWTKEKIYETQKIFSECKEDLVSIAEEISLLSEDIDEMKWMLTWKDACQNFSFSIISCDIVECETILAITMNEMAFQLKLDLHGESLKWTIYEAYGLFKSKLGADVNSAAIR